MNDEFMGELKEFKRITLEELAHIKKDIKEINDFKAKLLGMAIISSVVVGGISELLMIWITK